ncbi:CLUMA_CG013978, isoform A [Clunio marinus]|uniref:CLUMA_CG013978, isoform A n=1 Tax=Clunio marinus TaxID=568069 RepID=A0A1J1IQD9_9DIPT|nr:CLUMA_CG013978, isoform A [Clunio marinus]
MTLTMICPKTKKKKYKVECKRQVMRKQTRFSIYLEMFFSSLEAFFISNHKVGEDKKEKSIIDIPLI